VDGRHVVDVKALGPAGITYALAVAVHRPRTDRHFDGADIADDLHPENRGPGKGEIDREVALDDDFAVGVFRGDRNPVTRVS
jgi:hypothetical protein